MFDVIGSRIGGLTAVVVLSRLKDTRVPVLEDHYVACAALTGGTIPTQSKC